MKYEDLNSFKWRVSNTHMGFLSREDLAELVKLSRLEPVLVRCGSCRFTAPAQDIQHLIDIIARDKVDYVRDVSLPARG
jgi:hypothetical protein